MGKVVALSGQFAPSAHTAAANPQPPTQPATTRAEPTTAAKAPSVQPKESTSQIPTRFHWSTVLADAQKRAKASNLPILALFTGPDWCGPCIKLEQEALSGKAFKSYARSNFIPLKVALYRQSPQSAASKAQYETLCNQYQIKGVPALLILSQEGEVLGRPDLFKRYSNAQNREQSVIAAIQAADGSSGNKKSFYLKIALALIAVVAIYRMLKP